MSSSRQLAAIMFTDIVGYTQMMQEDEHKTVAIIKNYSSVLEKWVKQFHGRIVNYYGDGSLCIFSSITDAIHCSIELQREFRLDPPVPLRIGVHIGEVFFEDGKALGDGVNVASRIQSLGQENTILVSSEVHDKIKNNSYITSQSLGLFDFTNVTKPMEVFALSNDGLHVPLRKNVKGKTKSKNTIKRKTIFALLFLILVAGTLLVYKLLLHPKEITTPDKSIAVLPFIDMSQSGDQEFFSDGLTEDIITQLAKIKAFRVTSRTSVMQYKNNAKTLKEIAKELSVANILEGSVQRSGEKLRITAQLINTATDEHLWAESYDRSMQDIFSIQTDIASKIALALQAKLTPQEKEHIEKKYTENSEAYQLYLQGRYYWNQRLEGPVRKSIDYFMQAIAKDTAYALAYAGLGDAYLMLGVYSVMKPKESFPVAKSYAEKALQLDPTLAEAYSTLIDINIHYFWNTDAAEKYFQKAITANPQYANAYHWYSEVMVMRKQFDKAVAVSKTALEFEPYSPIINLQLGVTYICRGDYQRAVDQLLRTIGFDSSYAISYNRLGMAYLGLKQYDEAIRQFRRATELAPGNTRFLSNLGFAEAMAGKKDDAKKIHTELLSQMKTKYVPYYDLAVISLGLGEKSEALTYLDQAYADREPWMPFIGVNPLFSPLKDNPGFQKLVRKVETGKSSE